MQISKDYFDEQLLKISLQMDDRFEKQSQILITHTEEQVESLARMVQEGFEDLRELIDVRERVQQLEGEMRKIKEALHV
jgi:hypothetical protein